MRKRPVALFLAALLFLYFPMEFGWKWAQGDIIRMGDVLFSLVFPLATLYGLIRVTKLGWYTLIGFAFAFGLKDLYAYYMSHGTSLTLMLVHFGIYMISLTYFINPRIKTLYFDPKLRWWRAKRRNETHCPVICRYPSNDKKPVWDYPIMKNVSVGGCFIETEEKLGMHEMMEIAIPLSMPLGVSVVKAKGEVRWISNIPTKPGMGIEFHDLPPAHFKALRRFVMKQL